MKKLLGLLSLLLCVSCINVPDEINHKHEVYLDMEQIELLAGECFEYTTEEEVIACIEEALLSNGLTPTDIDQEGVWTIPTNKR